MADEAVIVAAAAGLWYLLRGKKRQARVELPAVMGPQPKAIPVLRDPAPAPSRQEFVVSTPMPLPPVVAAALAPVAPPAPTLALPAAPVKPAPILMPPVPSLPVVSSLPAPSRRPEKMFHRQAFVSARGQLMPSADASRIYPPAFPTFLK
jgi:hypothetical protein